MRIKKILSFLFLVAVLTALTIPLSACEECTRMGIAQHPTSEPTPTGFYIAGLIGFVTLAIAAIFLTKPKKRKEQFETIPSTEE